MLAVPLGTFFKLLLSAIANTCMITNSKRTELCLLLFGVERKLNFISHIEDGLGKEPDHTAVPLRQEGDD
jgi:hypothetical protein